MLCCVTVGNELKHGLDQYGYSVIEFSLSISASLGRVASSFCLEIVEVIFVLLGHEMPCLPVGLRTFPSADPGRLSDMLAGPVGSRCTPYFFANSATVMSSRISSSATLALKSAEWFFLFVMWGHLFNKSIHLSYWPEIPRPPLMDRMEQSLRKRSSVRVSPFMAHISLRKGQFHCLE